MAEFGLLGPLVVSDDGIPRIVSTARQRVLLAALLLRGNRVVPVDELAEIVWDGAPPSAARAALHNHVMRLRRTLNVAIGARIRTYRSLTGYLMEVGDGELDVSRFAVLHARGCAAAEAGQWLQATADLREALALWRGEVLADVPSQLLRSREAPLWTEKHLQAVQWRVDADLHLGRHDVLIAELTGLVAAHPIRERFHEQLMLALYRAGRQTEALAAYRGVRHILRDELGVEPGPGLRDIHRRILDSDPGLRPPDGQLAAGGLSSPAPRLTPGQLPADLPDFTGRQRQVRHLHDLLTAGPEKERPGVVVVAALAGGGGIGKTALAIHAAHRVRRYFPDGQLHAHLAGTSTHPVAAGEVLGRFLRDLDLDLDPAGIPAGVEERAARYRSLLVGKRVLVVLDDARDATQVRPLLPGISGCVVIVTSRSRLPGLHGAHSIDVDVLGDDEAHSLFARIVGDDRVAGEPDATADVMDVCAGLPLAIRIAAARLSARPVWTIRTLADRLTDTRRRLDELAAGDLAVRVSFDVSYQHLSPATHGAVDPARAFRLLSLVDGPDIALTAAAALLDRPAGRAEHAVELLVDARLLECPTPGRYRFHDLLRIYAAERAEAEETRASREEAISRVLTWYLHSAVAAARVINPLRSHAPLDAAGPAPMAFSGYDQALAWLDAERSNLVAAVGQAARQYAHEIAWKLPVALWDLFSLRNHWADWVTTHEIGLSSARRLRDRTAEAWLLNHLASGYSRSGRHLDAIDCHQQALPIRRETRDRRGEAATLANLGITYREIGRFGHSMDNLQQALAIYREIDLRYGEGMVLHSIGEIHRELGRYDEAVSHHQQALAAYREAGDRFHAAEALANLSQAYLRLGQLDKAIDHSRQAVGLNRQIGHRFGEAMSLTALGNALLDDGQAKEARRCWLEAHVIFGELGDPREAEVSGKLRPGKGTVIPEERSPG